MRAAVALTGMVALLAGVVPPVAGQGVLFPLVSNGPAPQRINLVFLAEAYTAGQTNQFLDDTRNLLNRLLGAAPLNAYSNSFNADAIFVASAEAGSDRPSLGVFHDTYFNSSFESYGIAQLLTIPPNSFDPNFAHGYGKVNALLQALRPEFDFALVVVNDPEYGGSGGDVLVTSTHRSSGEIVTHEFGHTFAGLGDEYSSPYPGYPDVEEPNTTRATNRAAIKWNVWILDSTPLPTPDAPAYDHLVGLFEGAHYHDTGWYRPKRDCRMRTLGTPFCEVCGETLIRSVYGWISPVDGFDPATNTVLRLTNAAAVSLSVAPFAPTEHALSVQWHLNEVILNGATNDTLTVVGWDLPVGTNRVRAVVRDWTALVRNDPAGVLEDSVTWRVASTAARPQLFLRRAADHLVLGWSSNAIGFALESTATLGTTNTWQRLGIITNDGPLTFTGTNGPRFLRLGPP